MTTDSDLPQDSARPRGAEVIQAYLKTLDGSPGVYRMLDDQSRVLEMLSSWGAGEDSD